MGRPAEYTRDAIIKAAVILFAEKGFEGTSVRDIVAKAGVNQAAINYHFKGDTAIFEPPLVDLFLRPSEWLGRLIVCCDERIDVLLQLLDGGEGCAVQRLALEN